MTSTTKSRTTTRASRTRRQAPKTSLSPNDSDSSSTTTEPSDPLLPVGYLETGRCGECLRPIMAIRLGGADPQHIDDRTPLCSKREVAPRSGKDIVSDEVFEGAKAFNERHRAVLDAHDPLDRNNWHYKPAGDGNKAIRTYLPTQGLK